MKHTDGPWKATSMGGEASIYAENPYRYLGMIVGPDEEANANLMAAAPELLEALEQSLEWFRGQAQAYMRDGAYEPHSIISREIRKFEAVIARARGYK